jgi:hypothetical protein
MRDMLGVHKLRRQLLEMISGITYHELFKAPYPGSPKDPCSQRTQGARRILYTSSRSVL